MLYTYTTLYYTTGGRLVWAVVSDAIGRRPTFMMLTAGSVPMYVLCHIDIY